MVRQWVRTFHIMRRVSAKALCQEEMKWVRKLEWKVDVLEDREGKSWWWCKMRLEGKAEARLFRLYMPHEGLWIFSQEHWSKSLKGLFVVLESVPICQTQLGTCGGDIMLRRFKLTMVLPLWKDRSSLGGIISSCQTKLINTLYFWNDIYLKILME